MDAAGASARLAQVAAEGEKVEVILVLRGSVRPVDGSRGTRWRVRLEGDRVLTFRAEWVLAARSLSGSRDRD
jgi:hypothetical protein